MYIKFYLTYSDDIKFFYFCFISFYKLFRLLVNKCHYSCYMIRFAWSEENTYKYITFCLELVSIPDQTVNLNFLSFVQHINLKILLPCSIQFYLTVSNKNANKI